VLAPNWRLQLAGAATTFCWCAKEPSMKQTTRRCATYRRAPQLKRDPLGGNANDFCDS